MCPAVLSPHRDSSLSCCSRHVTVSAMLRDKWPVWGYEQNTQAACVCVCVHTRGLVCGHVQSSVLELFVLVCVCTRVFGSNWVSRGAWVCFCVGACARDFLVHAHALGSIGFREVCVFVCVRRHKMCACACVRWHRTLDPSHGGKDRKSVV